MENNINPPIIVDTGATISVTPFRSDIIYGYNSDNFYILGLDSKSKCIGTGIVHWKVEGDDGDPVLL